MSMPKPKLSKSIIQNAFQQWHTQRVCTAMQHTLQNTASTSDSVLLPKKRFRTKHFDCVTYFLTSLDKNYITYNLFVIHAM